MPLFFSSAFQHQRFCMKKLLLAAKHDLAFQRLPASFCLGNVNQDQTPIPRMYVTGTGRYFC